MQFVSFRFSAVDAEGRGAERAHAPLPEFLRTELVKLIILVF